MTIKWMASLAGCLGLALLSGAPAARGGGPDRFPGFVYTSPDSIRDAQEALQALKYLRAGAFKEGTWDAVTREAARDFQRDHFLKPDGRLTRDTMALLMTHAPRTRRRADGEAHRD